MRDEGVIELYGAMVYRIAYRHSRNSFDADDIYQEVFLRYFRAPRSFTSEEHRKAWLIRVTVNTTNDFHSRKASTAELESIDSLDEGAYTEQEGRDLDLEAALDQLPHEDRTIVYLYYYEERKISEIAGIMKLGESAVKKRLERARKKLALYLSPE